MKNPTWQQIRSALCPAATQQSLGHARTGRRLPSPPPAMEKKKLTFGNRPKLFNTKFWGENINDRNQIENKWCEKAIKKKETYNLETQNPENQTNIGPC